MFFPFARFYGFQHLPRVTGHICGKAQLPGLARLLGNYCFLLSCVIIWSLSYSHTRQTCIEC